MPGLWDRPKVHRMDTTESRTLPFPTHSVPATGRKEVRCAVRFPLSLPATLTEGNEVFAVQTQNISASGALFSTNHQIQIGTRIEYSLRMPGNLLGTHGDVLVHCVGRVVRCCLSQSNYLTAATIDDYQFAEQ